MVKEREMEEERVRFALARTKEFKAKISFCIHKESSQPTLNKLLQGQGAGTSNEHTVTEGISSDGAGPSGAGGEEKEVVLRLLKIRDALDSLENKFASLQTLHQEQRNQRELAQSQVDDSRKKLLEELKKYKGKDFQVIYETAEFFSVSVEVRPNILLPQMASQGNRDQNEIILPAVQSEEKNQSDCEAKKPFKGFGFFINAMAKPMLMLVGLVSVLTLTGFKPRLSGRRKDVEFNKLGILRNEERGGEKKIGHECPPGKVLSVKNGVTRCIAKKN